MTDHHHVHDLHEQAMQFAEQAFFARRQSEEDVAQEYFYHAYLLEAEAARLVAGDIAIEPTRSVLLRSAATLALDCGEVREAEKLIATALLGNPPALIARELRELSEQVNARLLLPVQG